MLKIQERVFNAFFANEKLGMHGDSLWTDGASLWSYATCIVTVDNRNIGAFIVNATKYSTTTTKHVHAFVGNVDNMLGGFDGELLTVDYLPFGSGPDKLQSMAEQYHPRRSV